MLWDPIRLLHSSPSSDGACAVVLCDERVAAGYDQQAWVDACRRSRTEPPVAAAPRQREFRFADRTAPGAVYRQAGIVDPLRDLDVAELFVPYSSMEPLLLENLGCPYQTAADGG